MVWGTERSRQLAALVATPVLLFGLLLGLVACGGDDSGADDSVLGKSAGSPGLTAAQIHRQEQRVLNQRVRAVSERDVDLFLRRVNHRDKALMARQRRYFDNLMQLPLTSFGYRVQDQEWDGIPIARRWGKNVHIPRVQLTMQLEGFDAVPIKRTVGFVFSFRKGKAMIVSDRTRTGKPLYEGTPAPWDLTAITAREDGPVLGIFDGGTEESAGDRHGGRAQRHRPDRPRTAVHLARVRWSSTASRTPHVLASFTDVPGGSLDHLGALTFPTYAEEGQSRVASTRMLVMPSCVRAGDPFLGRIVRHELSHLAISNRDDGAPVWLSEGIAEYLGAREIPVRDRIIPTSALTRAQTEDAGMPVSKTFNNTDQEWHYALSWMACDYIAETSGESRLVGARRRHAQQRRRHERPGAGSRARAGARLRQQRAGAPCGSTDPQPLPLSFDRRFLSLSKGSTTGHRPRGA